jgi:hypothetical protein
LRTGEKKKWVRETVKKPEEPAQENTISEKKIKIGSQVGENRNGKN